MFRLQYVDDYKKRSVAYASDLFTFGLQFYL